MKGYRRIQVKLAVTTEVVQRALQGDETAGQELLNFLKRYLRGVASNVYLQNTSNDELYEFLYDWVMGALFPVRMKYGLPSYYDPTKSAFKTWLYSVISSGVAQYLKTVERRKPVSLHQPVSEDVDVPLEEVVGEDPEYNKLHQYREIHDKIVSDLDSREKVVLDMLEKGYKKREIAEELGVSPATITWLVKRVQNVIRKYYPKGGESAENKISKEVFK